MSVKLNSSSGGSVTIVEPTTSVDYTATLPQANCTLSTIVSGTVQATTSGSSIDFTGIPSWVRRITVMFRGVSTNGSNNTIIQLGTSGGVETTGYIATFGVINAGVATQTSSTTGFMTSSQTASRIASGIATIVLMDTNVWVFSSVMKSDTTVIGHGAGEKSLSSTLDRIRITTTGSVDTFDAGSVNIMYE